MYVKKKNKKKTKKKTRKHTQRSRSNEHCNLHYVLCPYNEALCETPLYIGKNGVCRGIHYFFLFWPKKIVWVFVRTASMRWF